MKLLIIVLCLLLSSCTTYQRCKEKYGTSYSDTITVENSMTVSIPKDSIVTTVVNDTLTYIKEITEGRAKLIIQKTPQITYIKAECDSITKTVTKIERVPIQQAIFGVNPIWKKIAIISLIVVVVLGIILTLK